LTYRESLRDIEACLRSDHTVVLASADSRKHYPEPLRRIHFYDAEHDRRLRFLTNNFDLPALTICLLYKSRWQVELFFKALKQSLKIKTFVGTSENAVQIQIWTALIAMPLLTFNGILDSLSPTGSPPKTGQP